MPIGRHSFSGIDTIFIYYILSDLLIFPLRIFDSIKHCSGVCGMLNFSALADGWYGHYFDIYSTSPWLIFSLRIFGTSIVCKNKHGYFNILKNNNKLHYMNWYYVVCFYVWLTVFFSQIKIDSFGNLYHMCTSFISCFRHNFWQF